MLVNSCLTTWFGTGRKSDVHPLKQEDNFAKPIVVDEGSDADDEENEEADLNETVNDLIDLQILSPINDIHRKISSDSEPEITQIQHSRIIANSDSSFAI